jgi:hypothetical protein
MKFVSNPAITTNLNQAKEELNKQQTRLKQGKKPDYRKLIQYHTPETRRKFILMALNFSQKYHF